ncbi:amino acid adenylation domain-containing protein [Streptomyces sp. NPDC048409]|uniref:non-ribosomal peptide synthetase n=1 Tax=Streptomyces sp. NPDC048409 TaxID=3154723 RepID=UPI00344ACC2A
MTEAFVRQAARIPHTDAVVTDDSRLTYGELLDAARELATRLDGPRRAPVAICLERTPDLVVAILGTLLAGRPYLPLDPAYPDQRLRHMLADSGAIMVLCDRTTAATVPALTEAVPTAHLLRLGEGQAYATGTTTGTVLSPVSDDDLAYILYTSGSTGRPKGVAMAHGPLARLIDWHTVNDGPQNGRVTAQFAPVSFDVSFQEIFSTLSAGGTLVLVPEDVRRDPDRLLGLLTENRVDRLFLPAAALHQLAQRGLRAAVQPPLRDIVCAGEQLQVTDAVAGWLRLLPGSRLHNHYGPTETHVVTAHVLDGDPDGWPALPPIGTPLPHVRTWVLDPDGESVADGEPGELYLGGACLAEGYLGRPDLTAERFTTSDDGSRRYHTGDLVRQLPGGALEYLGRSDRQVKIRGYRVEVGEVELALSTHRDVAECCVVTRPDQAGQLQLVAYIVPAPGSAEFGAPEPVTLRLAPKWHHHLSERLPEFMVPAVYVTVDRLPLTPSGKVDRAALPAPSTTRPALAMPMVPPSPGTQQRIAVVWQETLQLDEVGIDDNFFDLGGNSLLLTLLHTRLTEAELPGSDTRPLTLVTLFEHPTIRALAAHLDEAASGSDRERPAARRSRRERPARRASAVATRDSDA